MTNYKVIIDKLEVHNGNPISRIEMSQNGKYLVSYSEGSGKDNEGHKSSIVVWKVEEITNKGIKYKLEPDLMINNVGRVFRMWISNKKILAYTYLKYEDKDYDDLQIEIINLNNNDKVIIDKHESKIIDNNFTNLYYKPSVQFCNFNPDGDLILFCKAQSFFERDYLNLIYVYSINDEKNTKKCRNIYMPPKEAKVIKITEYDKIWLRIKDHIHEWSLHDNSTTIVLDNIAEIHTRNIKIFSNESYTCINIYNEVILLSNKLGFPIVKFDILKSETYKQIEEYVKLHPKVKDLLISSASKSDDDDDKNVQSRMKDNTKFLHPKVKELLISSASKSDDDDDKNVQSRMKDSTKFLIIKNHIFYIDEKEIKIKEMDSESPQYDEQIYKEPIRLEKHSIIWKIEIINQRRANDFSTKKEADKFRENIKRLSKHFANFSKIGLA